SCLSSQHIRHPPTCPLLPYTTLFRSAVSLLRKEVNRQADPTYMQELAPLAKDSDKVVRMQLALTIGLVNTPMADRVLEPILKEADRKSTRLNSSHQIISYAVFCLKKK